jgi:hypothetical protein
MDQKEPSHISALWSVGMFKPYDCVVMAVVFVLAATTFFWWMFSPEFQLARLLMPLMALSLVVQLWLVSLVYRCIWFVIKTWADIKNLPVSAAKLAVAFSRGTPPSNEG